MNREILETSPPAEGDAVIEHLTGFVNSFVQEDRRERWMHLLLKRPRQTFSDSHKLHGHLDRAKCSQLQDGNQINQKAEGVYYNFFDEPVVLTAADAFAVSQGTDAIFSIVPGKLAVYFFHEDEIMLCKI